MPQPQNSLYVSRPEAERFLEAIAQSLNSPEQHPLLFHLYTGGVGKTRLRRKLLEDYRQQADFAWMSFGETTEPETPLEIMVKLYKQLPEPSVWKKDLLAKADPFLPLYDQYEQTLLKLQTPPSDGKSTVSSSTIQQLKRLGRIGLDAAEWSGMMSKPIAAASNVVVDKGLDATVAMLSLKDQVVELVQSHQATKRDQKLQQLVLKPTQYLTEAFLQGLMQRSKLRPIVLILDTYEKATSIDPWLRQLLLTNPELLKARVRFVVAGRHSLVQREEGWRKLQQDYSWVSECGLNRFTKEQTAQYLQDAELTQVSSLDNIYQVTRGLPYYLNWIREETSRGRSLNFAEGNREIERLLLQGFDATQQRVIKLAACCRWFDASLIRSLLEQQRDYVQQTAEEQQQCYDWLTQQAFVEPTDRYHRLDDVARDVFRRSFWQAEPERFERTHDLLARYFKAKSDREVAANSPSPRKYNNPDWRNYRVEFLYYVLFTRRQDAQLQFISHLLEARYFRVDEVVQIPFGSILSEQSDLSRHEFLPHNIREFLTTIVLAVLLGWAVLQENPLDYEWFKRELNLSQSQVDAAVDGCLSPVDRLEGLAKFAALLYRSNRCPLQEQLDWVQQAQAQATQLETQEDQEFISGLFLWDIGNRLYELGRYQEAIDSYDHALHLKPDLHEAWNNRGSALVNLGRYQEAIDSFDHALHLKPDDHDAWNNRGSALVNLGRYQEAIDSYDHALHLKPDYDAAWNNRGNALGNLGRYQEAIDSFDHALQLKPDFYLAWYNKACCYGLQGDVDKVIECLGRAIELDPNCREMAKTDADFDAVRESDRFQQLLEGD